MAITLPTFTPLEDSLFLTLYARALDNRRPHPILGDATADQIVRTTDYDYSQLHIDTNLILNVALRAKKLDQVASDVPGPPPRRGRARPGRRTRHPRGPPRPAAHRPTGTTSTSPPSPPRASA